MGVTVDYPVNTNFPALIPCFGSLSLGEPNLTYCVPLSSENTLFVPSSNFWVKAAISSGVLKLDFFNLSGCGSTEGVTNEEDQILPETTSLALAVTNSPPCSKPCRRISMIERVAEKEPTDILAEIAPRLAGVHRRLPRMS